MARIAFLLNGDEVRSIFVKDRKELLSAYVGRPKEGTHRGCRVYGTAKEFVELGGHESMYGWAIPVPGGMVGAVVE